jgi:Type IV secretion-system coupling protein DNA-binding domain
MEDYEHIELGIRHGYGGDTPFSFTLADRRHHTYIIGKTGVGKSTLLLNTICEDIRAGRGVGVIDPHGPLAREVLNCVPKSRTEDVVYFDPSDADYPISWNLLKAEHPERKHLVASGIVAAFKSMWHDSWGPRLEYILYASVATLMECENASLIGISRLLSDPEYRRWALKQVEDPGLLSFWQYEFERYDERFLREAIAPIQNKVGRLLLTPVVRNIFGQVKSKVSARFMMDNRRIFIANLAKGAVGEDTANLLGALLVTQFEQAAMSRIDRGEESRADFHLVVDEFQSFATDSFEGILSEARK